MSCSVLRLRLLVLALLLAVSTSPRAAELMLRDEVLVRTPEGRMQLKYLVSCALPEDTKVVATAGTERFEFAGGMGLAPGWARAPLTGPERRRVSACMLARANEFGVPVLISLRSDSADAPHSLTADEDERRSHPFFEAGFFGDLFKDQPEGFVCIGDAPRARAVHLRRLLRVCSLPAEAAGQERGPRPLSRCGLVIAGSCSDAPFMQNGTDYRADVLKVYLPAPK